MSDRIPIIIDGLRSMAVRMPETEPAKLFVEAANALEAERARADKAEKARAKLVSETLEAAAKVQARIADLEVQAEAMEECLRSVMSQGLIDQLKRRAEYRRAVLEKADE